MAETETGWDVVPEKTQDHWLTVRSQPEMPDCSWEWEAAVSWDGCVRLFSAGDPRGGLHVCDLDRFIEQLKALKAAALEHFHGRWPE